MTSWNNWIRLAVSLPAQLVPPAQNEHPVPALLSSPICRQGMPAPWRARDPGHDPTIHLVVSLLKRWRAQGGGWLPILSTSGVVESRFP